MEGEISQEAASGKVEHWPSVSGINHHPLVEGLGKHEKRQLQAPGRQHSAAGVVCTSPGKGIKGGTKQHLRPWPHIFLTKNVFSNSESGKCVL